MVGLRRMRVNILALMAVLLRLGAQSSFAIELHELAIDWFSECGCTGMEVESVGITRELLKEGFKNTRLNTCNNRCPGQTAAGAADLQVLQSERKRPTDVLVVHVAYMGVCGRPDEYHAAVQGAKYKPRLVFRGMTEETQISSAAAMQCNQFYDEIWVPSSFHVGIFKAAGVEASRLHVIPETIDFAHFDPAVAEPKKLFPKGSGVDFVFLSVFKWENRKNWRGLLDVFMEAFKDDPRVGLYIKTSPYMQSSPKDEARGYLMRALGFSRLPDYISATSHPGHVSSRVVVNQDMVPAGEMPSLYLGADAFVLPTHGEGWGLPLMEAMAMERPTVATNFGGQVDFMSTKNAFLVDVKSMVQGPGGGTMAEPDMLHLKKIMLALVRKREKGTVWGRKARASLLARFGGGEVGRKIGERLGAIREQRCVSHPAVCSGHGAFERMQGVGR